MLGSPPRSVAIRLTRICRRSPGAARRSRPGCRHPLCVCVAGIDLDQRLRPVTILGVDGVHLPADARRVDRRERRGEAPVLVDRSPGSANTSSAGTPAMVAPFEPGVGDPGTLFSLFHTLERWRVNLRTWLTEYLSACADAGGRVPEDCQRFLPWNRPEARLPPRGSPAWPVTVPPDALRYCGRLFSKQEMQQIRAIIAEDSVRHRLALSKVVCERLDWRRANGQLKDMSCRVSMLRMHRDGLIRLPPPARAGATATASAPLPYLIGGTGVADHRPRRCAARTTGASARRSARSAVVARVRPRPCTAAGGATTLPGHQPAPRASRGGVRGQRLEGCSARPLHRLERCPTRSPAALGGEQRPLPDSALGAGAQSRFHRAGAHQPPACPTTGRLATATDRCSWRPSCSPTASPAPATAPPTRPSSARPRA